MNRTVCSRLVLGLAVLSSSAFLAGCSEEAPKPAETPAVSPAPAAPGAPAETPKADPAKPAETPAPAPGK